MSAYYSTTNGAHLFQLMGSEKPTGYSGPYVVIDPEDREQVERLRQVTRDRDLLPGDNLDDWQAALREFANPKPPKPPADVAARVTDRRDNIWRLLADGEWVCVDGPDRGEYLTWDGLTERGPLEVQS